jgi:phenylacetate-coenzyme A ligase PaaK-like adenylate-forming protein
MKPDLPESIFSIKDHDEFNDRALEIFMLQSAGNKIYSEFIRSLRIDASSIRSVFEIPFLPVEFFKNHMVITGSRPPVKIFESSGTTGAVTARHYVADTGLYEKSFLKAFTLFYDEPDRYMIAALLPSYTERGNSSLVYMMDNLIKRSSFPGSGFYKDDPRSMIEAIAEARMQGRRILLMGVSFALLDLAEKYSPDLHDVIIVETGGMKGRRKEITRDQLHSVLKKAFNVSVIHSEYGMTELLSQAYSKGEGIFRAPPWMKILIRDPLDPLTIIKEPEVTGGINIIDLANINSCSFISTGDMGRHHENGTFEVLGRIDNSDVRGCNLLIE